MTEQYVQNFKKYQRLSGHNDITLREMFEKGLIKRVKECINMINPVLTSESMAGQSNPV